MCGSTQQRAYEGHFFLSFFIRFSKKHKFETKLLVTCPIIGILYQALNNTRNKYISCIICIDEN